MTIPGFDRISGFLKQRPRRAIERRHLMLAGIDQTVFLNQWGAPEIQIGLDVLEGFYKKGSVALSTESLARALNSVWIYKERNRIFFFTKNKMVAHFKWSDFKEKRILPRDAITMALQKKPSSLKSSNLSLVA